ncbi:hypothetical protein RHGRI_006455 [Rhododendron griersonianum]|uniref:Uncharacterized protein n=1 Tax=Rhododendron griersonianum TaxID=479676 RepID=A0AAV6KTK9_9ERIC|nr:hypothetical protein RHGRI_006455 [Rhododendron griersonianum]
MSSLAPNPPARITSSDDMEASIFTSPEASKPALTSCETLSPLSKSPVLVCAMSSRGPMCCLGSSFIFASVSVDSTNFFPLPKFTSLPSRTPTDPYSMIEYPKF